MKKVKFSVEVGVSKKNGEKYAVLVADLGYCRKYLNFKRQDLAELLGLSVFELMESPSGTVFDVEV